MADRPFDERSIGGQRKPRSCRFGRRHRSERLVGSADRQGALWGRAPDDWAGLLETFSAPLREAMLDETGVIPGSRLLDAGCGAGGASVLAGRRGALVTGLDASSRLLEIARRRVPAGVFHVGDLEAMPFEDVSFDCVIAVSSDQYTDDPVAALREMSRVADTDGRVAVGLFGMPEEVEFSVVLDAFGEVLGESPPAGGGPFALSGPDELKGLIRESG